MVNKSNYNGINVFRIWMPSKSKNKLKRILSWGWFCFVCCIIPLLIKEKIDCILCCSPPLFIGLSADLVSRIKRKPFIYNVQEIYPDIAILSGYLNNKVLIALLFEIEKYIYRRASHITVIGDVILNNLKEKGVATDKLSVIMNYPDPIFLKEKKYDSLRKHLGLDEKYIFGYAGNFGIAQDIKQIIELAKQMKDIGKVHFLLVGSGVLFKDVVSLVQRYKLENITILDYLDHKVMPDFYASVDILFVPLKAELGGTAFPSKALEIMASGKPMIAVTSKNSDLGILIERAKCGFIVEPEDKEGLYDIAIRCVENAYDLSKLGINGLNYIKEYVNVDKAVRGYLEIFEAAICNLHKKK